VISVSNDKVSVKSEEDEWLIAVLPLPQVGTITLWLGGRKGIRPVKRWGMEVGTA